jgi:putative endonuclease
MMAGMGQSPLFSPVRSFYIVIPAKAGTHFGNRTMFFVYLLASQPHGTLYVGVTSDLVQRVGQHKNKAVPGFTSTYGVDRLMWFEAHELWEPAIRREKQIKEWKRAWKIQLIETDNPHWADLYSYLTV